MCNRNLSVNEHPQGNDDTNKRLVICKRMQLHKIKQHKGKQNIWQVYFEWNPIIELIKKLIVENNENDNYTRFPVYRLNENIGFSMWLQQWKDTHQCIIQDEWCVNW